MNAHGHFHWNELMTHDAEKAKGFYGEAMGWGFEPMPMDEGTYWICKAGDDAVGGLFEMQGPDFDGMPENWMPYIAVDDIDERAKKAKTAGATIVREPWDVPGVGRIAMLKEPGGAMVGWVTPSE